MPSLHVSTECSVTQCFNLSSLGLDARHGGPCHLIAHWSFLRSIICEGGGFSREDAGRCWWIYWKIYRDVGLLEDIKAITNTIHVHIACQIHRLIIIKCIWDYNFFLGLLSIRFCFLNLETLRVFFIKIAIADIGMLCVSAMILRKKTDNFFTFVFVGGWFLEISIFLCFFIFFIELFDLAD